MINYDDFSKLELRVATILNAVKIEGSDKLIKIQLDLGEEKRQIVSGIAQWYTPEDLIGKQIIIVANLEPRQLMGETSNGMLLAAGEEVVALLQPDKPLAPGTKVN